jgi:hypothetical protein
LKSSTVFLAWFTDRKFSHHRFKLLEARSDRTVRFNAAQAVILLAVCHAIWKACLLACQRVSMLTTQRECLQCGQLSCRQARLSAGKSDEKHACQFASQHASWKT